MELTVRPARPADYEDIDRLTLKGFQTAHRFKSQSPEGCSQLSRSSSYVCTIKGSAYMRSTDALTFVCVKHTIKQGLLGTIFGRVARRGSDASGSRDSSTGRDRSRLCYEDLRDITGDRRESAKTDESVRARETDKQSQRASSGIRATNVKSRGQPSPAAATERSADSGNALSMDSRSTSATQLSSNENSRRATRKKEQIKPEKSFVLLAAEASSNSIEQYRSIGTLQGHEVEFGLGAGIRNRVKRHEGPLDRLLDRDAFESHVGHDYDPSRGTSAYKKPENIDLEASVSPEGFLMARPSPLADASEFLESSPKYNCPSSRRGSGSSSKMPFEKPFHLLHRRRGSNASAKADGGSPCEYNNCIEEKIVGSVTYAPYESGWGIVSDANDVELRMLSVNPVRGVAGLLIDHCVRIAEDELRSAIHVLVNATNQAAHLLYIRHGFVRNALKDRFDPNAKLSLKCFTMDLGNARPTQLPKRVTPCANNHSSDRAESNLSSSGYPDLDSGEDYNKSLKGGGMITPTDSLGTPNPIKASVHKDRFRAGLIFQLHSLRRQRLNMYQELNSGIHIINAGEA